MTLTIKNKKTKKPDWWREKHGYTDQIGISSVLLKMYTSCVI